MPEVPVWPRISAAQVGVGREDGCCPGSFCHVWFTVVAQKAVGTWLCPCRPSALTVQ